MFAGSFRRMAIIALTFAAAGVPAGVLALDPGQPVKVTPIATTAVTAAGQPIVLPQKDVRAVVSQFDIAPGAKLPVHQHPFPRYAYVVTGDLEVTNVETGASNRYGPGDFVVEMVGLWHQGANVGADPVRLIVIDQVEGDVQQTILRE